MKTTKKTEKLNGANPVKNYVIIGGKKVSRTWAAVLSLKGTGVKIIDMKAVLK